MQRDLFAWVTQGISELLIQHESLFQAMGLRLFMAFAVINITWFGLKSALQSADGHGGFQFGRFASLMLQIAFGYAMITYYSTPIPGLGVSFRHLITDHSQALVDQINSTRMQEVMDQLAGLEASMPYPTLWEIGAIIRVAIVTLVILIAEAAIFTVISFGYIALAVAVLLGPLFIPFFIVEHMEWLFWGWFRCLLQYSFYPVVASAYVFVFGSVVLRFLGVTTGQLTAQSLALLLGPLVVVLIAFAYGVFRVPSLVYSIFAGRSGDYALPRLFGR